MLQPAPGEKGKRFKMETGRNIGTVALFTNQTRPKADQIRLELRAWLEKRDIKVLDSVDESIETIAGQSNLVICLGGDGTILRLAGKMTDYSVPVLGVNVGSLGFITEVRVEELYDELKSILLGHVETEKRMLLCASVKNSEQNSGQPEHRFQALNDIVVSREGLTRYLHTEIEINSEIATRFPGDGVIVATPTGSTAYSLSAGGPIVHPMLDVIVIAPICPHDSAIRPLVVSGDKTIKIRVTCNEEREKALLSADGQVDVPVDNRTVIEVKRSDHRFLLVKSSKRSYFGMLREKFRLPM